MSRHLKILGRWALVAMLIAGFVSSVRATDQELETLVTFTGDNGSFPGSLTQGAHGNFYGTTYTGGKFNKGTLFEIPLNKPLLTLASFDGGNGANPQSGLAMGLDGNFYGTTYAGGAQNLGTIFEVSPEGKLSTVYTFDGANGANPVSHILIGPDGKVYGATYGGGADNLGTIFEFTPSGGLKTITTFNGTNGSHPGGLIRGRNGDYFGTTYSGGPNNDGVVFELGPVDYKLTQMLAFNGVNGANPHSSLGVMDNGTFYGTTYGGGKDNMGTAFTITPEGVVATIVNFNGANGAHPNSGLVRYSNGFFYIERLWQNMSVKAAVVQWSGVNFCGTTSSGGAHNLGTIFQITSEGAVSTLVSFSGTSGNRVGSIPDSIVPGNDGNLYGSTYFGGTKNKGTVFRLMLANLPPPASPGGTETGRGSTLGTALGVAAAPAVSR